MTSTNRIFSQVWVIEDDVGITGGTLLDFLTIYDSPKSLESNADLLTHGEYKTMYRANET